VDAAIFFGLTLFALATITANRRITNLQGTAILTMFLLPLIDLLAIIGIDANTVGVDGDRRQRRDGQHNQEHTDGPIHHGTGWHR
jgi:hypothetical protein